MTKHTDKTLGERLRAARKRCNLTQVELAGLAGVSEKTVVRAEAGRVYHLPTLRKMADALGQDLGALLVGTTGGEE